MNKSPLVVKSNKLVESAYRLSLSEQRILLSVLASIDSHPDATAITAETCIELTASGIEDLIQTPRKRAYEIMKDAAEKLSDRWVVIEAPDPEERNLAYTKTRWVHAIDYLPAQGCIRLYLAPKVLPYLTQLASAFTRYRLKYVSKMKSVYAIRLYELLVQWQSEGTREIDIEWLKNKFQVDGEYPRLSDLKRRVIEPAVKQINEHSNLWVKCNNRKLGKRVVAFQFVFGVKATGEKGEEQQKDTPSLPARTLRREDVERQNLARPGESWEEARDRLRKAGYKVADR